MLAEDRLIRGGRVISPVVSFGRPALSGMSCRE